MGLGYRLLGGAFRIADVVVPKSLLGRLDADGLIAAAGARPGEGARAGLRELLAAIEADSALSFFGRLSLRFDMLRLLRNAQKIEDAHRETPALAAAPITAPIFILGLPRSGTTFLHTLMAEDAESQVPRNWQTMNPAPRPADFVPERDKKISEVDRQLKLFAGLAPGFAQMHPITADSPQECSEITAHVLQSLRFDTTFRVPGYLAWLEARGHDDAFAFHKKFLQFLQNGKASRWVLKCPDHSFSIDSILRIYPDARFVIVHRDPIAVLGSVAYLTEVLRKPFLKNVDSAEIGAQVAERWIEGADLLLAFDQRTDIDESRKIHIFHDDLITTPLGAIAQIYARFGLTLRPAALAAMSQRIATRPRGGYGAHPPYSLETFRINAQSSRDRFASYVSAYCRQE
jgi:hypothetical protein